MAHLEELSKIKSNMSQFFLKDKELVSLLTGNSNPSLPAMSLLYDQVFPYDWIDETVVEQKSFLCYDLDVADVKKPSLKDVTLWIWIFVHKDLMRTAYGVLRDRISSRVDKLINGSDDISGIGTVELKQVRRFRPAKDFYGRELKYFVQDFNRFGDSL
jgi:hypothetical protein